MNTPRLNLSAKEVTKRSKSAIKRFRRENTSVDMIPLFDWFRDNNPPKLIGWYNYSRNQLLTANFSPSISSFIDGKGKLHMHEAHRRREQAFRLVLKEVTDASTPTE